MVLEGSTGYVGALGSQVAVLPDSTLSAPELTKLDAMMSAADAGAVALRVSMIKPGTGEAQELHYESRSFTDAESGKVLVTNNS